MGVFKYACVCVCEYACMCVKGLFFHRGSVKAYCVSFHSRLSQESHQPWLTLRMMHKTDTNTQLVCFWFWPVHLHLSGFSKYNPRRSLPATLSATQSSASKTERKNVISTFKACYKTLTGTYGQIKVHIFLSLFFPHTLSLTKERSRLDYENNICLNLSNTKMDRVSPDNRL